MKFLRLYAISLVALSAFTFSSFAAAQEAVAVRAVNLRAGPDRGYPLVTSVRGGSNVYVNGCLRDYRWCDVTAGANRGWVYTKNLQYTYQGRPTTIYGNGPTLALPVISFILGRYWNDNYQNRPWYRDQNRWNGFRPGYRPPIQPPRPPIVRPKPPRPSIQPPRPPIVRPQPPQPPRPSILPPRPQPIPMPKPQVQPPRGPTGEGNSMGPAPVRQ